MVRFSFNYHVEENTVIPDDRTMLCRERCPTQVGRENQVRLEWNRTSGRINPIRNAFLFIHEFEYR